MTDTESHVRRMTLLASRAKTRAKTRKGGLFVTTQEELFALLYFADLFLEDFPGDVSPGEIELAPHPSLEKQIEVPNDAP